MQVQIVLFGYYREKLPTEARGEADLDLPAGATLGEALTRLEIIAGAACVVNGQAEPDKTRRLQDGDRLQIIPPVGGGQSQIVY